MLRVMPITRSCLAQKRHPVQAIRFQLRSSSKRFSSMSFASPRMLSEILKMEMIEDKSSKEIQDIWTTYHEEKDGAIGLCCSGEQIKAVIERGIQSPFFIQPVFREEGFFNLCSQFQKPRYFLLCMLEDYQNNPTGANALVTLSLFDDLVEEHDLGLIRGDIINKGIHDDEGRKIVQSIFDVYANNDSYRDVQTFNTEPMSFDFNDYVSRHKQKWNNFEVK